MNQCTFTDFRNESIPGKWKDRKKTRLSSLIETFSLSRYWIQVTEEGEKVKTTRLNDQMRANTPPFVMLCRLEHILLLFLFLENGGGWKEQLVLFLHPFCVILHRHSGSFKFNSVILWRGLLFHDILKYEDTLKVSHAHADNKGSLFFHQHLRSRRERCLIRSYPSGSHQIECPGIYILNLFTKLWKYRPTFSNGLCGGHDHKYENGITSSLYLCVGVYIWETARES